MYKPVWFDMDGVLCNFGGHYTRLTGVEWGTKYISRAQDPEKWTRLEKFDHFFLDMPWMPYAKELWAYLAPYNPNILSAVAATIPNCKVDKREWCIRELSLPDDRIVLVNGKEEKKKYCTPGAVLIDDHSENRKDWELAGGIAPWNENTLGTLCYLRKFNIL